MRQLRIIGNYDAYTTFAYELARDLARTAFENVYELALSPATMIIRTPDTLVRR